MRKSETAIKHIRKKLRLYCYICITIFSHGRLLEMHNITPTPIQICIGFVDDVLANRLNVGIDSNEILLFIYIFQRSAFKLEKNKSVCQEKFLVHPVQVTESTYYGIAFQTIHTSNKCTKL